jgi:AcrR family transcriptional regulator
VPRAGLTHDRVVAEAELFADEVGLGAVTVSALAARLGVAQPSLYKHIDSLADLQRSIALRSVAEITDTIALAAVGRARGDALLAICTAYRAWARLHPGRYASIQRAPAPDDDEMLAVVSGFLSVCFAVLAGYGLAGDDAVDALRALRSSLHGFVTLEALGGFGLPVDVDRSFDRMVSAFGESLPQWTGVAVAG